MKKQILLIVAFLVMISNSYAQNLEPAQHKFLYKGDSVYIDQHSDFRVLDTSFAFLWHWYNGKKMSKALGVNLVHVSPIDFWARILNPDPRLYAKEEDLKNVADSVYMIVNSNRIRHGYPDQYKYILAFPNKYTLS